MAGNVTNQQTLPMTVGVTYYNLNSLVKEILKRPIIAVCTKTDFCFQIGVFVCNLSLIEPGCRRMFD